MRTLSKAIVTAAGIAAISLTAVGISSADPTNPAVAATAKGVVVAHDNAYASAAVGPADRNAAQGNSCRSPLLDQRQVVGGSEKWFVRLRRPGPDATIDPGSLHAILTSGLGLSLRRPNPLVPRLTRARPDRPNQPTEDHLSRQRPPNSWACPAPGAATTLVSTDHVRVNLLVRPPGCALVPADGNQRVEVLSLLVRQGQHVHVHASARAPRLGRSTVWCGGNSLPSERVDTTTD